MPRLTIFREEKALKGSKFNIQSHQKKKIGDDTTNFRRKWTLEQKKYSLAAEIFWCFETEVQWVFFSSSWWCWCLLMAIELHTNFFVGFFSLIFVLEGKKFVVENQLLDLEENVPSYETSGLTNRQWKLLLQLCFFAFCLQIFSCSKNAGLRELFIDVLRKVSFPDPEMFQSLRGRPFMKNQLSGFLVV